MTFDVYIWMSMYQRSLLHPIEVEGKNAREAFNKAKKMLPNTHSSRIRVERKNDRTQA